MGWRRSTIWSVLAIVCCVTPVLWGEPSQTVAPPASEPVLPSIAEARERATLLHDTFDATLKTMHQRYFREDAGMTVPSRALEDVFHRMARRSKVTARWLAVNAQAMSLDHEPQDDFEKAAVRALSAGKESYEEIENGRYRRAGAINLSGSCLKCHAPPPMRPNGDRVAGLVLSMPVK